MKYENEVISKRIKRNKKIKKFLFILLYIILIPIILFSLFLIILELGNSGEIPSSLNMEIYTVVSESMKPKLNINDIIIVKKGYPNDKFKVGNIITYKRSDGEIITHRIQRIITSDLENAYITKGDNNDTVDEEIVKYDMIIGKVIYTMPKFGTVMKILKNKCVFISCIIILVLIYLYDRKQKQKKIKRKIIREKHEKKSDFYF